MRYQLLKILLRPDIAYLVKGGSVVEHDGRDSESHIDDIEAVCQIHKAHDGIILGKWVEDHYRITVLGKLKTAEVSLNNVIN